MIRKIIQIDEEKCNGCGACAAACHEGAIGMVDGKAKLLRDDYCDGLGDCLPACPTGAITFVVREAAAYDEAAVQAAKRQDGPGALPDLPCGCPGSMARTLRPQGPEEPQPAAAPVSQLRQWPVQIPLVPVQAPYYQGADLLVAADCSAYAFADMHRQFIRGRVVLVGCPKLDSADHTEKLTAILSRNDVRSVTVVRMQVPCCGGLERAVRTAVARCGRPVRCEVVTLSAEGKIIALQSDAAPAIG